MDSGPGPFDSRALVGPGKRLNKDFLVKVRLDAKEIYLLDELMRKAGLTNRARFFRRLLCRADELEIATDVIKALADRDESDKRLEACVAKYKGVLK